MAPTPPGVRRLWLPASSPGILVMIHSRFPPVNLIVGFTPVLLARDSSHPWTFTASAPHPGRFSLEDRSKREYRPGVFGERKTRVLWPTLSPTLSSPTRFSFSNRFQSSTKQVSGLRDGRPSPALLTHSAQMNCPSPTSSRSHRSSRGNLIGFSFPVTPSVSTARVVAVHLGSPSSRLPPCLLSLEGPGADDRGYSESTAKTVPYSVSAIHLFFFSGSCVELALTP